MRPDLPRRFLAIEGNIGAGKTTLARMLAGDFAWRLLLEQFDDNPFLQAFYQDPERYALPVELFFLTERFKQWEYELQQGDLFRNGIVTDYTFSKTLLFARNNLVEEEFRLFKRIYDRLRQQCPAPDLIVYLHRPIPWLLDSIARRGRAAERPISAAYLERIQQAYLAFFQQQAHQTILMIDLGHADFEKNPEAYRKVLGLLAATYAPGVHHRRLDDQTPT